MEYKLTFEVPDELDVLISDPRRKWVTEKLTEMVRELLAHEAVNGLDSLMLEVKPILERQNNGEL